MKKEHIRMPRTQVTDEVQVLRFFEEAPLEQAQMLFNIVKEKMRTRMGTGGGRAAEGKRKEKARAVAPDTAIAPETRSQ